MRAGSAVALLFASTLPAAARSCDFYNGVPYCDAGCRIVRRWWHNGREWISYMCPPTDFDSLAELIGVPLPLFMIGVLVILSAVVLSAIQHFSAPDEKSEAQQDAETALGIERKLKEASDEADRFIEEQVAKAFQRGKDDRS